MYSKLLFNNSFHSIRAHGLLSFDSLYCSPFNIHLINLGFISPFICFVFLLNVSEFVSTYHLLAACGPLMLCFWFCESSCVLWAAVFNAMGRSDCTEWWTHHPMKFDSVSNTSHQIIEGTFQHEAHILSLAPLQTVLQRNWPRRGAWACHTCGHLGSRCGDAESEGCLAVIVPLGVIYFLQVFFLAILTSVFNFSVFQYLHNARASDLAHKDSDLGSHNWLRTRCGARPMLRTSTCPHQHRKRSFANCRGTLGLLMCWIFDDI